MRTPVVAGTSVATSGTFASLTHRPRPADDGSTTVAREELPTQNKLTRSPTAKPDWRTSVSLVALVVALLALVLLPIWRARMVAPLLEDLRSEIEPSRSIVTRIHLALAMEGPLARDFMERRDTLLISGYRAALADEREGYAELEKHVNKLGPSVRSEFNALQVLQTRWHASIEESFRAALAAPPGTRRFGSADPFHPAEYDQLLVGAARLDEALSNAADKRWAEASATNEAQRWLAVVIGFIALGAAIIVGWLARGVRLSAYASERDKIKLQEAVEARARMVRGITHDLKNPLNAIIGYTELLTQGVKGPMPAEQRQSVERIQSSAESLLALINDILEMSQAEKGRLSIVPRTTHVETVIEDAVEEHRARAAAAGHAIKVELAPHLPAITTDGRRVRQVLGNLLTNAIKYTPPDGAITVRSSIKQRDGSLNDWLVIEVADSGRGIPADKTAVIFEEFTRLDEHRDMPGAGLGLAIASRVTRLLGGDLTVESVDGHGSTFTIWLPLDEGAAMRQLTETAMRDEPAAYAE